MISQKRLKEVLSYDPETGIFIWILKRKGVKIGEECGRLSIHGYREIGIDYVLYRANRLAFLYMKGYLPDCDVDHVNRVKLDNSFKNLRAASRSQNMANGSVRSNNTSGIKGVIWDLTRRKWRAQIGVSNKKVNLGRFNNKEDAIAAYNNAAKKSFGEFACINRV